MMKRMKKWPPQLQLNDKSHFDHQPDEEREVEEDFSFLAARYGEVSGVNKLHFEKDTESAKGKLFQSY